MSNYLKNHTLKRLIFGIVFLFILCMPLCAQKVLIYYEGPIMYVIDHYAYEFQSLIEHYEGHNPVCEIRDSAFITFLDKKILSAEMCTQKDECLDATYKPGAMIQIVYIKDKYCYYTLNLSSGWDRINSLTIDGKSYIPDQELQDVILEIIKYRVVYKQPISVEKIQTILDGERMKKEEAPYWPLILPDSEK